MQWGIRKTVNDDAILAKIEENAPSLRRKANSNSVSQKCNVNRIKIDLNAETANQSVLTKSPADSCGALCLTHLNGSFLEIYYDLNARFTSLLSLLNYPNTTFVFA